jgi:hypothetical protein
MSVRNFFRLPPKVQPSCPGLSPAMRARFIAMTLRQNNNPPNWKSLNSPRPKKVRQVTSRIVHKEFVLAGQAVNSTYYCDVSWRLCGNVWDFAPNFGNKRTGCCTMTVYHLTLPLSPRNFWPKTTWLLTLTHQSPDLAPCNFYLFLWLKILPFWHKWGDGGRTGGSAECPQRIWFSCCS